MFYVLKCVYLLFCAAFMHNKQIIIIIIIINRHLPYHTIPYHNLLHCHRRRTGPRPQATLTDNKMMSDHEYASGQTDIETYVYTDRRTLASHAQPVWRARRVCWVSSPSSWLSLGSWAFPVEPLSRVYNVSICSTIIRSLVRYWHDKWSINQSIY